MIISDSKNLLKYLFSIVIGVAISTIIILLFLNMSTPINDDTKTLTNTVTTTQTEISIITSSSTKTITQTTSYIMNKTGNINDKNITSSTKTIEVTITKTIDTTRTRTATTTLTMVTTNTITITQTSTKFIEKPSELNHLYTAIFNQPGYITQLNLSDYQVENYIEIPSKPHVITTDDQDYLFVGTLGEPVQIIKIKIPEFYIESFIDIPDVQGGVTDLHYFNDRIYASLSFTGSFVEYDASTLNELRRYTYAGARAVKGVYLYQNYIYATMILASDNSAYALKINYNNLQLVNQISLNPSTDQVDFDIREFHEANNKLYTISGGLPTRLWEIDPISFSILNTVDYLSSEYADRLVHNGQYLYFNNDAEPAGIIRLDMEDFSYDRIEIPNVNGAFDVDIVGDRLYATCFWDGIVVEIDLQTFSLIRIIKLGSNFDNSVQSVVSV